MRTSATFEFQGMSGADVLGLWTTPSAAPADAISFDAHAVSSADVPVWRANVPTDLDSAQDLFHSGEKRLTDIDEKLLEAMTRLSAFKSSFEQPVSFDVSAAARNLPQPERELLGALIQIGGKQPESFGLGEDIAAGLSDAAQKFQIFVERVLQAVAYYAWVETNVNGTLLGRTLVGWTGDAGTAWRVGIDSQQAALHDHTLALALASRQSLMRMFTLASRGAVLLATLPALLAMPGGALLALPVAWKFINDVLQELDHQEINVQI